MVGTTSYPLVPIVVAILMTAKSVPNLPKDFRYTHPGTKDCHEKRTVGQDLPG